MKNALHYVIVGTAAAGIGALRKILQLDPYAKITCISSEKEAPYNKCLLADYVHGLKTEQELLIFDLNAHRDRITWKLGATAVAIDAHTQTVTLSSASHAVASAKADSELIAYDKLLIATGCRPFIPTIPGIETVKNISTFQTFADAQQIDVLIKQNKTGHALVVGAGLSGIEAADALAARGWQVTVVERSAHILPRVLTSEAADILTNIMQKNGVTVLSNMILASVEQTERGVSCTFNNNHSIIVDAIIVAAGMRPNSEWCASAIKTTQGYIDVNQHMFTGTENIWAAGDISRVPCVVSGQVGSAGTWPDAMLQGVHAAHSMVGQSKPYSGSLSLISSAFFGLKCGSFGVSSLSSMEGNVTHSSNNYRAFWHVERALKGVCVLDQTLDMFRWRRSLMLGESIPT